MAYCPQCGAATSGNFCEKCGTAVSQGGSSASSAPPIAAPGLTMNVVSALCYLIPMVCPIVFLVLDPYKRNKEVRFAAYQSIFLFIALIIINKILKIALDYPYRILDVLEAAGVVLFIYLAFKAFQNEKVILPGVGPLAQKQA